MLYEVHLSTKQGALDEKRLKINSSSSHQIYPTINTSSKNYHHLACCCWK